MSWSTLHPWLRPYAEWMLRAVQTYDPSAQVTSVGRTSLRQRQLYAAWQRGENPYPVAVPGTSSHEMIYDGYSIAWDMSARREVLYAAGRYWQSLGGHWGGEKDPVHFQLLKTDFLRAGGRIRG